MDSTVQAALISAGAVLASGLLTLLITGSQEKRRRVDAATARDADRAERDAERLRAECLRIAEQFYDLIDTLARIPNDFMWGDVWSLYQERYAERFDYSVRKAIAIGGPTDLREKVLHVLQSLPDVSIYAELEQRDNYEQLITLLRLGGDLAADAARGGGGDSATSYEEFMAVREKVAKRRAGELAKKPPE